jgi:hypothetical protein
VCARACICGVHECTLLYTPLAYLLASTYSQLCSACGPPPPRRPIGRDGCGRVCWLAQARARAGAVDASARGGCSHAACTGRAAAPFLSVCLSVTLSLSLSLSLSISLYLSLSFSLSLSLSLELSLSLSLCDGWAEGDLSPYAIGVIYDYISIYLFIYISIYTAGCQAIRYGLPALVCVCTYLCV